MREPEPDPDREAEKRGLVADRSLPWRIGSAVLFLPALYFLVRAGSLYFFGLVAIQIGLGLWEFYGLMSAQGLRPYRWLGLAAGFAVAWFVYAGLPTHANLFLSAFLLGVMSLELLRPRDQGVAPMSVTLFGVLYVGWLSSHLLLLRELPHSLGMPYAAGAAFVFLVFLPTWSCDTAAYAVGSMIGRRRLLPTVSPQKSVEGSIAGLVAAVLATWLARIWFAPFLPAWHVLPLGLAIGIFAQVGDLAESLIKRTSRVKDSAVLIPGHGGVLDRFDSLYFTAPLVFYYLKLVLFGSR
ncbi:MAG TPA: phosphatidate cytidylyltransferase [Candidatus Eisenbacteria bacterium]|nr:phosphatidate cytidylyltransferase [Candidatus Eisenbacteria bacterium]